MPRKPLIAAATISLLALSAAGCLKRKETITVAQDGRVTVALEYESKNREFGHPDAMPSTESGWDVAVASHTKKDGSEEHALTGQRTFAPGQRLPRTYAAPNDPNADLYVDFPTELQTERRDDGLYFHIRRTYSPRRWAYVQYWHDRFFDDKMKKLSEKPAEQLTARERIELMKTLVAIQARRQIELAEAAARESGIELAPDEWLAARRALLDVYEELDYEHLLKLQEGSERQGQDPQLKKAAEERLNREVEAIMNRAGEALTETLRAQLAEPEYARFQRASERVALYHQITEATGTHYFEIRVKMPGRVVAHNADKVDENGEAVWEFDGRAFRDRPYELLITSRLQTAAEGH